jgi:hypothetical protein
LVQLPAKLAAFGPQPGQFLFHPASAVFAFLENVRALFGRGPGGILVLVQLGLDALPFLELLLQLAFDALQFHDALVQLPAKLAAFWPQPGQFLFHPAPAIFAFLESICASFGRGFGSFLVLVEIGFDALPFPGLLLQFGFGALQLLDALV